MGLLLSSRIEHDLAVYQTNAYTSDRAVPRNIGNRDSDGSRAHTRDLGRAVVVNCEYGHNYRNIVSHILREEGAYRAVYHTRSEYSLIAGLTLALGERSGDLAYRVELFLIVYREGEKSMPSLGLAEAVTFAITTVSP